MKAIFLVLLLLAAQASAITNEAFATASALWQRLWNHGELFSENFDPEGDMDGDGQSNYREFLAGTDPSNGTPPAGVAVLDISYSNPTYLNSPNGGQPSILTPAAASLTWSSVPKKSYRLLVSPDLSAGSWNPIGDALEGDGNIQGKGVTLSQPDGSTPAKLFFRLEIGDLPSSVSGSGNTAYQDYILTLHPEYANAPGNGNNPGGGNQNPAADDDHDGLSNEEDALATEPLVDWKKTPEFSYVWIPVEGAPDGYRAISVNNKGQVLFENYEFLMGEEGHIFGPGWPNELASTPVGKIWDPSKPAQNRWSDIFFHPVQFNLRALRIIPAPPPVLIVVANRTVSMPQPTADGLQQSWFIRLHSIGDDGSVMANASVSYSKYDNPVSMIDSPNDYITDAALVFLWNAGGYDSCQLLGGGDRGFRPYDPDPTVFSSWTANGAAGFVTDENQLTRAVLYDQDKNNRSYNANYSQEARANQYTLGYALPLGATAPPVTSLVAPNRINNYGPAWEDPRIFTRSGRVLLKEFDEDPNDSNQYNQVLFGGGSSVKLQMTGESWTLTDLPGGGLAIGGARRNLQVIKNGKPESSSLSGITEFDDLGTGIGGATASMPSTNGRDLWRNDEWFSFDDLTGDDKPPASVAPQRITSKGIIWAGDIQKVTNCILVPASLRFDRNRDTMIDSKDIQSPTPDKPWRFWMNDDYDVGEDGGDDASSPQGYPYRGGDYTDHVVNSPRDLVDFFPVQLEIKNTLEILPSPQFRYFLTQDSTPETSSLGVLWYPEADPLLKEGNLAVNAYLRNVTMARLLAQRPVQTIDSQGVEIPADMLAAAKNEKGVMLLEGRHAGNKPLKLEIRSAGGVVLGSISVPVRISKVADMYRWLYVSEGAGNFQASQIPPDPPNWPDAGRNGKQFVFVHGYSVDGPASTGWGNEFFKRLFWSGSNAGFTAFAWHGNQGQIAGTITPDYQLNLGNAFGTAKSFKQFLDVLPGEKIVAAHSMGNILVGSAIHDWGASPTAYFMLDAAAAKECYDPAEAVDSAQDTAMQHPAWVGYPKQLRASEWHALPWPADDERKNLTWRGRLSTVPFRTDLYHFYSSGEEVLNNPSPEDGGSTSPIPPTDSDKIWALQEKRKGYGITGAVHTSNYGGWRFHGSPYDHQLDILIPVSDQSSAYRLRLPSEFPSPLPGSLLSYLKSHPFFDASGQTALFDPEAGAGSSGSNYEKANLNTIISEMIPCTSFAAGRNAFKNIFEIDPNQPPNESRNIDMEGLKTDAASWPFRSDTEQRWLHSDIGKVAFVHTWRVYDKFRGLGKLNDGN